jgi:4-diphosphocytidyl-2-C-methyl-D-erythritol kinase
MISFPNCKINLGLSVTGKFPDGYHSLETVMYPLPFSDILEVILSLKGTNEFAISGIPLPGQADENLCFKAWKLLNEAYNIGAVEMHLHKIVPAGAGLGGGSGDAAFTLKILNEIFHLQLTETALTGFAARLGMDCPFFIANRPALATGRGEILEPVNIDLSGYHIAIIKPDIHISTAVAYSGVKPVEKLIPLSRLILEPVEKWRNLLVNDFESSVFGLYPVIRKIKEKLYGTGAVYAAMSGSGSAVYGLFENIPDLKNEFPGCLIWQGIL